MAKIKVKLGDTEQEVDVEDFKSWLRSDARITELTVSVRESRPRAQYQTHERFLSARIDLSRDWQLVDLTKDLGEENYRQARAALGEAMAERIQAVEGVLYDHICEIQKKDNITPYPRTER